MLLYSKFDQRRIIGRIAKAKRNNLKLTQKDFLNRARLDQSTVSNIENLQESLFYTARQVTRDKLIEALGQGYAFSYDQISSLLWLYDGEITGNIGYKKSRQCVLDLIEDELIPYLIKQDIKKTKKAKTAKKKEKFYDANVRVFQRRYPNIVESSEVLLRIEKEHGQRMLVSEYPSHLTFPKEIRVERMKDLTFQGVDDAKKAEKIKQELTKISNSRENLFEKNIYSYGERSIHCKKSLEDCLKLEDSSENNNSKKEKVKRRRKQVERCIALLKKHDNYDMRFSNEMPRLEWEQKSISHVILRGVNRYEYADDDIYDTECWGPHYIQFSDEISTLSFLLDFENQWSKLTGDRDETQAKREVIKWLEGLLSGNILGPA